jgi:hypothetical protein
MRALASVMGMVSILTRIRTGCYKGYKDSPTSTAPGSHGVASRSPGWPVAQPAAMARTGLDGAMARSMAAWLTRCPPGPKMACLREGSK